MDHVLSFGQWLKQRRQMLGLTQRALAQLVHCSVATIRKLESNERRPSKQIAKHIATALSLTSDEQRQLANWVSMSRRAAAAIASTQLSAYVPPLITACVDTLPSPLTTLIGRDQECAWIQARLLDPTMRLLTLTGPPGVGKTCLALHVANNLRDNFDSAVWFIGLELIPHYQFVIPTIAQALGIQEPRSDTILTAIKQRLRSIRALIVLDNFEHLLEAAPTIADILSAAPSLTILATSREGLCIYGEHCFEVGPLPVPSATPHLSTSHVADNPAIALFTARAQAAQHTFALTDANVHAVAAICQRLDGLPLAIELIAARSIGLTPHEMVAQLNQSLSILATGSRDRTARQQTLSGAIQWSYELLTAVEQQIFDDLSVFTGGCTFEAAAAVVGSEQDVQGSFNTLITLRQKSLLQHQEDEEGIGRWAMLETIRSYAWKRRAACERVQELQRRHAFYYLAQAETAEPLLRTAEQDMWLERLARDQPNIRAALQWSIEAQDLEIAGRLGVSLWRFWYMRGQLREGRRWLDLICKLFAHTAHEPDATGQAVARGLHAKVFSALGALASLQGDYAAVHPLLEGSLAQHRTEGDLTAVATTLNTMGNSIAFQGEYSRAQVYYEESLALWQALGNTAGIATVTGNLGQMAKERGNLDQAEPLFLACLAAWQRCGNTHGIINVQLNLGEIALLRGEWLRAQRLFETCLSQFCAHSDTPQFAYAQYQLGVASYYQGHLACAQRLLHESLALLHNIGDQVNIARILECLAAIATAWGYGRQAPWLYGAAEVLRERLSTPLPYVYRSWYEQTIEASRSLLEPSTFASIWHAGRTTPIEQVIETVLGENPQSKIDPHEQLVRGEVSLVARFRDQREQLILSSPTVAMDQEPFTSKIKCGVLGEGTKADEVQYPAPQLPINNKKRPLV